MLNQSRSYPPYYAIEKFKEEFEGFEALSCIITKTRERASKDTNPILYIQTCTGKLAFGWRRRFQGASATRNLREVHLINAVHAVHHYVPPRGH
jgi:hypothetical protein